MCGLGSFRFIGESIKDTALPDEADLPPGCPIVHSSVWPATTSPLCNISLRAVFHRFQHRKFVVLCALLCSPVSFVFVGDPSLQTDKLRFLLLQVPLDHSCHGPYVSLWSQVSVHQGVLSLSASCYPSRLSSGPSPLIRTGIDPTGPRHERILDFVRRHLEDGGAVLVLRGGEEDAGEASGFGASSDPWFLVCRLISTGGLDCPLLVATVLWAKGGT